MTAELMLAPEVEQDVSEACSWYNDRRIGLGAEFLTCVDACIQSICRNPEMTLLFIIISGEDWFGGFHIRYFMNMSTTQ